MEQYFQKFPDDTPSEGDDYSDFQRWKWFLEGRLNLDNGVARFDGGVRAMEDCLFNRSTSCSTSSDFQGNWQLIGPSSYTDQNMELCPSLWIDPSNANKILAGIKGGGLWESIDGGILRKTQCQLMNMTLLYKIKGNFNTKKHIWLTTKR